VAHLKIDAGVGLGIVMAYVILAAVGITAYIVAKRVFELDRPSIGATINASRPPTPATWACLSSRP